MVAHGKRTREVLQGGSSSPLLDVIFGGEAALFQHRPRSGRSTFACHEAPLSLEFVTEIATKKTALYDEHVKLGAKMVPFAGWLMPVQYTSIMEEHQAVRKNVGMFDISHMGQLIVEGKAMRAPG